MVQSSQIQSIVTEQGLEPSKVKPLVDSFNTYLTEVLTLAEKAKTINVTSEDQKQEMLDAKNLRKQLRDIRLDIEDRRRKLKEDSLREGRAIDGISNWFKNFIIPAEAHLEKQEKFAEEIENKRQAEKIAKRIELLTPYTNHIEAYDLKNMSNETFDKLLQNSKDAYETQQSALKQAEEDRIAREKAEREVQEKNEAERLRLQRENKEKEQKLQEETKKRIELEEKVKKETEQREKQAEEEAARKRKILRAPDKEKLLALAKTIEDIELPFVLSPEARSTIETAKDLQNKFATFLKARANNL